MIAFRKAWIATMKLIATKSFWRTMHSSVSPYSSTINREQSSALHLSCGMTVRATEVLANK